jgi:hypothetical protein
MTRKQEIVLRFTIGLVLAILLELYLRSKGMSIWDWSK